MKILWLLTAFGAIAGTIVLVVGVNAAKGAPQEAAAAAVGIALAVLPYVFCRAVEEYRRLR